MCSQGFTFVHSWFLPRTLEVPSQVSSALHNGRRIEATHTVPALGEDSLANFKNSGKTRENPSGKAFAPRIYIPPPPPPPHPGSHPPPRHFYISGFQELTFKSPKNQIRVWKPGANMFPLFFGTFIRSFPGIPKGKTLIGSVSTREFWLWGPFM